MTCTFSYQATFKSFGTIGTLKLRYSHCAKETEQLDVVGPSPSDKTIGPKGEA
jgi:hypothetical protein